MLAPFVLTGIIFTIGALAWARHRQRKSNPDVTRSTEQSEQGGEQ